MAIIQFHICTSPDNYAGLIIRLKEGSNLQRRPFFFFTPPRSHPALAAIERPIIILFITTQASFICSAACSLKRSCLHGRGTAARPTVTQKERPLYLLLDKNKKTKNDAVQMRVIATGVNLKNRQLLRPKMDLYGKVGCMSLVE